MITDIRVNPDGVKWGYYKKDMKWVVLDSNNNIVKEIVDDDGQKSVYFKHYGYQPSTFKEHLDKDGNADVYAQLDYCKSVNCPDCYYCVWISHMHLPPRKVKPAKKEVKHHKPVELSKWDKLAKATINKPKCNDPDKHPLYDKIVEVFCGEEK
jgi:hypothetical protein